MRVLVLTPQLPYPPHQGTTLRNYNVIAKLALHHQIHLLSFFAPDDDPAGVQVLGGVCGRVETVPQPIRTKPQRLWTLFASPLPDMAHRLVSPAFAERLRQLLSSDEYDVVQFEGIEMIPYLSILLDRAQVGQRRPRLVFDDHNAEYLLQKRVWEADRASLSRWPGALYSLFQWQRLRRYEAWACRSVDAVAAVSEEDAEALRRIAPGLGAVVVPNGVDIAHYHQFVAAADLGRNGIVFTGKMDFRPNVDAVLWFADRVFPLIRRALGDAQFYVVGQRPHRRLAALQERPGVIVTGRVPDIRPYIAGASVYVVPLRSGGGTRLKVLEAMASRRAIVSTSMGCDGFPVTSGRHVLIADTPPSFAENVIGLLRDDARREILGQAAFEFAQARYDWSAIVPLLETTYRAASTR